MSRVFLAAVFWFRYRGFDLVVGVSVMVDRGPHSGTLLAALILVLVCYSKAWPMRQPCQILLFDLEFRSQFRSDFHQDVAQHVAATAVAAITPIGVVGCVFNEFCFAGSEQYVP